MSRSTAFSLRWAFDISKWNPSEIEWKQGMSLLQKEEKEKIGQFRYKHDAKASFVGRLLMKKAIVKSGLGHLKLTRTERGKPQLIGGPLNFDFNVSHQGKFVVLAAEKISDHIDLRSQSRSRLLLGIDVMRFQRKSNVEDFFRLMRRQFTSLEWEKEIFRDYHNKDTKEKSTNTNPENTVLVEEREKRQLQSFYRLWALKESFVKADGKGLNWDLQRLCFKTSSPPFVDSMVTNTILQIDGMLAQDWLFEETFLDEEHCVASALNLGQLKKEKLARKVPFFTIFPSFWSLCEDMGIYCSKRHSCEYDWNL